MHARIEDAICPACGGRGLDLTAEHIDLPYLGRSLETLLRCDPCGYRHADFVLTQVKEPTRVSYRVATEGDMMVRVVRSSSGTIRIPELGVLIEPGISSEAFISNVEGILVRVERVLDMLHRDAATADERGRAERLMDQLAKMRRGQANPVTLVIEDPLGNSAILHDDAIVEPIPPDEADRLKVGMSIVDPHGALDAMAGDDPPAQNGNGPGPPAGR